MSHFNTIGRRDFLKRSSLLTLAPTVPSFLPRSLKAATLGDATSGDDGKILVVLQLNGGNDGINTIIPFGDDGYAQSRDRLRIPTPRILKVSEQVGFHPNMRGAAELFEAGRLSVVQGVGYPNPNRSHDVSMSIWQTARFDTSDHKSVGWIGRAIDQQLELASSEDAKADRDWSIVNRGPHTMLMGDESPPIAIRGRQARSVALEHLKDLRLHVAAASGNEDDAPQADRLREPNESDDLLSFVRRSQADAFLTSSLLEEVTRQNAGDASAYPSTELAGRLKMIAQLIKADFSTPVYYAIQPGYDTHAGQAQNHARLLTELSGALKAFQDDLQAAQLDDRVLVMCFSEFGRRVKENGSFGTDHGTSGPVILAGSALKPGFVGETPSLTDLENGDLKTHIDFRSLYASVLEQWLKLPSDDSLGGSFDHLELFDL